MRLNELNQEELSELYRAEMTRDFPPQELKPLKAMLELMEAGRYQALGLWEEDQLLGYALMWREPGVPFALLDYLGTLPGVRNRGLGGQMLDLLADYYREERVRCLCLDGERGWAAVAGSEYYEVEFSCAGGQVSDLVCSCFCAYPCKHEFAALTLLRQLLETVKEEYSPQYARSGYLAAVQKEAFFSFVLRGREEGRLIL